MKHLNEKCQELEAAKPKVLRGHGEEGLCEWCYHGVTNICGPRCGVQSEVAGLVESALQSRETEAAPSTKPSPATTDSTQEVQRPSSAVQRQAKLSDSQSVYGTTNVPSFPGRTIRPLDFALFSSAANAQFGEPCSL